MPTRWNNQDRHIDSNNIWNTNNFSNKDVINTKEQTQASAENLKNTTIDSSITSIDTKSNLMVQQAWLEYARDIHSLNWFLSIIDDILQEIEDTKAWISKKWLSKAWKKSMNESKAKLKQYEKQLKGKKNWLLKQRNAEIYDNDIAIVKNIRQQIKEIKKDIAKWGWGELSTSANYVYNSPENIRKANRHQADVLGFNQILEEELKNAAIQNIFIKQSINARDFYRRIAEWNWTCSQSDYQLFVNNSAILVPSFQRCWIAIPTNPTNNPSYESWNTWRTNQWNNWSPTTWNWWRMESNPNSPRTTVDYSNMEWWETFKKWWIAWLFDKLLTNCSNMTSGQRGTWKTLWVLGIVWGAIYWWYKFYSSKKIWWWRKIWATVAPIFVTQFATWKDPITLMAELLTWWLSMNEIKNKYGDAVGWLSSSGSETGNATASAIQSTMVFNSGATAGDAQRMTQTFKDDNRNRTNFYQQSCTKIQKEYWRTAVESFKATFSENFDEKKWNDRLSSFWVTSWTYNKEPIYSLADNAYTNQTLIEKFLEENGLKIVEDPAKKAELNEYTRRKNTQNELINTSDLEAHINDWFVKTPDQTNNNQATPQTSTTSTTNSNTPNTNPRVSNSTTEVTPSNTEIQIQNTIDQAIDNWLNNIYYHFEPKIKKINHLIKDIKKNDIAMRFPELTKTIKSEFITIDNNVKINIDEWKIAKIFDDFIWKLSWSRSTLPKSVKRIIKNLSRSSLKTKLNELKSRNNTKYYEMKNRYSFAFNSIFQPIVSSLTSQNISPEIICNWQQFNNVNDAINSMSIFR